mgnify:CR=1 FL=1
MTYQNAIHADTTVTTDFKALGKRIGAAMSDRTSPQTGIHKPSWDLLTEHGFWQIGCPRNDRDSQSWTRLTDPVEDLAAGCGDLGFVLSAVAHVGIIRMVQIYGTDAQKNAFLPRLLDGDIAAIWIKTGCCLKRLTRFCMT